jgi:transglutaminase-like putative cysteine protease
MEPHIGFRVLLAFALWALYLVLEILVIGFNQVCWAFPMLFVPYLVAALGMLDDVEWSYSCFGAVAFLLLLVGSAKAENPAVGLAGLLGSAGAAGVLCLAGSIGLGSLLPTNWSLFSLNSASPGAVVLANPSVDIIRNLRQSEAKPVLKYSYATPQGYGTYLRLAALPVLSTSGFSMSRTDLDHTDHDLPLPTSIPEQPAVDISVEVDNFASQYLPLPWGASSFSASGSWGYDAMNSALVSLDEDAGRATAGLAYQLSAYQQPWTDSDIAEHQAGMSPEGQLTTELPVFLSSDVSELATDFTGGGQTAGQVALAMRDWLRSSEFRYSTGLRPGTPLGTIEDFLLVSRTGYCEQFAASLAIMARIVGIPSRVVVGFLPGSQRDGVWSVDTHDMHAWTELYLDGLGWVPLDPTPGNSNQNPNPSPSATPTPTQGNSPTPSAAPSQNPTTAPSPQPGAFSLPGWVPLLGAAVIILGFLCCSPRLIRVSRTNRRLSGRHPMPTRVEDAWDELRDRLIDAGAEWPAGTPRQVAESVNGKAFADDESSGAAVTALALLVERTRFAQGGLTGDPAALVNGVKLTPQHRWFPRSLFRHRRPAPLHRR